MIYKVNREPIKKVFDYFRIHALTPSKTLFERKGWEYVSHRLRLSAPIFVARIDGYVFLRLNPVLHYQHKLKVQTSKLRGFQIVNVTSSSVFFETSCRVAKLLLN